MHSWVVTIVCLIISMVSLSTARADSVLPLESVLRLRRLDYGIHHCETERDCEVNEECVHTVRGPICRQRFLLNVAQGTRPRRSWYGKRRCELDEDCLTGEQCVQTTNGQMCRGSTTVEGHQRTLKSQIPFVQYF